MKRFNLTAAEKAAKTARHIHPEFPVVAGISIGWGRCNLKCRMCPMFNVHFENPAWMSVATFEKILAQLPDSGDISIELTAMGEPLLHPEIKKILNILSRRHKKNPKLLVTNGHFLNDVVAEQILDTGINQMQISLNAYGPENYRWFTGSSGYHKVVANIEKFLQRKAENGSGLPAMTMHIAGIKEFADDFKPFLDTWGPKIELARVREIKDWGGVTKNNGISPLIAEEVICQRYPCAWLWECLEFYPSGDVYTCSFHPFFKTPPIGNINTQNLKDIWQAPHLKNLRQKHLQGRAAEIDFCADCYNWFLYPDFWDRIKPGRRREKGQIFELPELR